MNTTTYDNTTPARVGLVTCEAFPDLFEDDHLLVHALEALGIQAVATVWSRAEIAWESFDALVMRSPWDYFERVPEFRRWLDARIASGTRMFNSPEILEWNFDKRYLQELASQGVELVPTIFVPQGELPDIAALVAARGWNEIVVKPAISGGAYRTHRFPVHALAEYMKEIAGTLQDRGLLIQPFLPEILSDGEYSVLFFDGEFSHAVRKRPAQGEYRVQFQFGGVPEEVQLSERLIAQAHKCLSHAPGSPVYARVDGIERQGNFVLMELEIFEPFMFLACHPDAAARFARAIAWRLRHPE
jgi:glutathione synthase/RimK-type ligase-like ATP-grasp enzyme